MELVNETAINAGWTLGFQEDGRELLIVAAKATFEIPERGEEPCLSKEQASLIESDEFSGEPGFSATVNESDYAHRKPFCDVIVNGSAYAPNAKPCEKMTVGLHIGPVNKRFRVVGNRVWDRVLLLTIPSAPELFTKLPISYNCAYGGVDRAENNPEKVKTYMPNPVGVGYYPLSKNKARVGKLLPNTHELGRPANNATGKYRPMALSPMGRNFKCRLPFAGTYDKNWLESRAPFFPDDFDYRYFQCAPLDQQMPYPKGGEEIVLEGLTPDGTRFFRLPRMRVPVLFVPYRGNVKHQESVIDTIVVEPDRNRFMLTWRTSFPLPRNCFEIRQVVVGKTLQARRHDSTRPAKTHYKNLEEVIQANKTRRGNAT